MSQDTPERSVLVSNWLSKTPNADLEPLDTVAAGLENLSLGAASSYSDMDLTE